VDASERILFLDILRGMALFGIIAGKMRAFSAPLSTNNSPLCANVQSPRLDWPRMLNHQAF